MTAFVNDLSMGTTYKYFTLLLKENGLTAYRVAKDTGIAQTTLSDWKTGRAMPKVDILQKIARYFAVSVDWLIGNSEYRNIDDYLTKTVGNTDTNPGVLFVFGFDEAVYEVRESSFKEAIHKAAEYTGCDSDLFRKSLNGFEETDVDGIIMLFNHFSQSSISKVYWFDKEPYDIPKRECE